MAIVLLLFWTATLVLFVRFIYVVLTGKFKLMRISLSGGAGRVAGTLLIVPVLALFLVVLFVDEFIFRLGDPFRRIGFYVLWLLAIFAGPLLSKMYGKKRATENHPIEPSERAAKA